MKKKKTFALRLSDMMMMHILYYAVNILRYVCVTGRVVISGYFMWLQPDSAPQHTSSSGKKEILRTYKYRKIPKRSPSMY